MCISAPPYCDTYTAEPSKTKSFVWMQQASQAKTYPQDDLLSPRHWHDSGYLVKYLPQRVLATLDDAAGLARFRMHTSGTASVTAVTPDVLTPGFDDASAPGPYRGCA